MAVQTISLGADLARVCGFVGAFVGSVNVLSSGVETIGKIYNHAIPGRVAQVAGRILQMIPSAMTFAVRADLHYGTPAAIFTASLITFSPLITAFILDLKLLEDHRGTIFFVESMVITAAKIFNIFVSAIFIVSALQLTYFIAGMVAFLGITTLLSTFNLACAILPDGKELEQNSSIIDEYDRI